MTAHGDIASGDGWEMRCGDWREVLVDVEADALVTDTPYSDKTHKGHNQGVKNEAYKSNRRALSYASWTPADVDAFCEFWVPRVRGWFACMSCSVLDEAWQAGLEARGLYGFAPLPCVIPGMTVRMGGDGPSSWCVWLNVARPRHFPFSKWGTLPGEYRATPDRGHIGGKPLSMMRAIVRDYTRKGDLVIDPCAGGGTTLLAAVTEGRRAIGAELDPSTYDYAVARLRRGYTPTLEF